MVPLGYKNCLPWCLCRIKEVRIYISFLSVFAVISKMATMVTKSSAFSLLSFFSCLAEVLFFFFFRIKDSHSISYFYGDV